MRVEIAGRPLADCTAPNKDEPMDMQKRISFRVLAAVLCLLVGCSKHVGEAPIAHASYQPLSLALVCDRSTPAPLRTELPVRGAAGVSGNDCVERESRGADALQVTQIDIERNAAFEEPVYELKIRIDPKSQTRLDASMRRAMDAHRALAFLVNGSVVFQTLVMGLPKDGVISLGGFSSKQEAEAAAAPFKAPPSRQ